MAGSGNAWHFIQTEDFALRIRSDEDTIDDLIGHLETLRRKILRARTRVEQGTSDQKTETKT